VKIGNVAITRQRKVKKTIAEQVGAHLVTQDVRDIIARMARSEVKNYMAELAEAAELPFGDAAVFLGLIREAMNLPSIKLGYPFEVGGYANHPEQAEQDARPWPPSAGLTFSDDLLAERVAQLERRAGQCPCPCHNQDSGTCEECCTGPAAAVVETLPNGHTTTCTCPDKGAE
jgi:hypothetical protein